MAPILRAEQDRVVALSLAGSALGDVLRRLWQCPVSYRQHLLYYVLEHLLGLEQLSPVGLADPPTVLAKLADVRDELDIDHALASAALKELRRRQQRGGQ